MNYTILTAKFANQDQSAADIITMEAGSVIVSEADTPDIWPDVLASNPADYAPPPPLPVRSALEKLNAFLAANPDVVAALE